MHHVCILKWRWTSTFFEWESLSAKIHCLVAKSKKLFLFSIITGNIIKEKRQGRLKKRKKEQRRYPKNHYSSKIVTKYYTTAITFTLSFSPIFFFLFLLVQQQSKLVYRISRQTIFHFYIFLPFPSSLLSLVYEWEDGMWCEIRWKTSSAKTAHAESTKTAPTKKI